MTIRFLSPLRYPGGKGRLAPYIQRLLAAQSRRPRSYAEPFAGGAGAALRLLVDEHVRSIHINDLDPGVAAFWRCVFADTDEFARRIEDHLVTLDSWHQAKATYDNPTDVADMELGFATFLLNRCNRSGILSARPIGGLQQAGAWKIDARFNRTELAERVRFLGSYRNRVIVTQSDARVFIRDLDGMGADVLVYVDPPYLVQGNDLYLDTLTLGDHAELAKLLRESRFPWLLTYDADERVTEVLYAGLRAAEFRIAHTAQRQHVGSEYVVFGSRLNVPGLDVLGATHARWIAN
jgi:DNA adenine methylase